MNVCQNPEAEINNGRAPGARAAFTLVELLVVIAIIGLLVALLVPAVGGAREAARQSQCRNNLKQIGIAAQSYESANSAFPPSTQDFDPGTDGEANWGWLALMLPQLEMQSQYDSLLVGVVPLQTLATGAGVTNPAYDSFRKVAQQPVSTFICPTGMPSTSSGLPASAYLFGTSYPRPWAPSSYAACFGLTGSNIGWAWNWGAMNDNQKANANRSRKRNPMPAVQGHPAAAIADGLSNTFMAGEIFNRNAAPPYADGYTGGNWLGAIAHSNGRHGAGIARLAYYPINMPPNNLGTAFCFGSAHVGGGLFLFFDGSTRFIDDAVEFGGTNWLAPSGYGVYQKLGDCNDGQPISEY